MRARTHCWSILDRTHIHEVHAVDAACGDHLLWQLFRCITLQPCTCRGTALKQQSPALAFVRKCAAMHMSRSNAEAAITRSGNICQEITFQQQSIALAALLGCCPAVMQ
eukprot:scaffold102502_cov24-Tisochrysis_lutea.AAC.1